MNALVVFDSRFGNTERIAQAVAGQLERSRLLRISEASVEILRACDLLVVGGPTQLHRTSPEMSAFLEGIPHRGLQNVPAAAFDTRYRMSAFLTGSAAAVIARKLSRSGVRLIAPAESFFIERDVPPEGAKRRHELEQLEAGEIERAEAWARLLSERAASLRQPAHKG
jgi:flavodoxin